MNLDKFLSARLSLREASIPVPELAEFFEEGEDAVWTVRAATAAEIGRANDDSKRQEHVEQLVRAMAGAGDKVTAIRNALGLGGDDVPQDVSRRISLLASASVSPEIGEDRRDVAVKISEMYPTVFYTLTTRILELTGEGAQLGKPKPSGAAENAVAS